MLLKKFNLDGLIQYLNAHNCKRIYAYFVNLNVGHWDSMEEYTRVIPRVTTDSAFYQAILAIHRSEFHIAQQVRIYCVTSAFSKHSFFT